MYKYQAFKGTAKDISQMKLGLVFSFIIAFLIALFFSGCSKENFSSSAFTVQRQFLMGTIVEVTSSSDKAAKIVFDEFRRLEENLSRRKQKSLVVALNREGSVIADRQLLGLIKKSLEISKKSEGAFDITAAALIDIWKKAIREKALPQIDVIKHALTLVGWKKIYIDENKKLIKFDKSGMKIDLGGIAKGFALDLAVAKLKREGITCALINAGGDIYCLGTKSGKPWKVAVRHPRKEGKFSQIFSLTNKAIATSGDYEQFFTIGEKRYSHIIDPRTGYPADSGIRSVTVIASDATTADALATAIFVLGEKKGLALAKQFKGIEVKIER